MRKSPTITLHPGRDKSVRHRHPWLFSGAIARIDGNPDPGEVVKITDAAEAFLAWGYFNSRSQIAVRLLTWTETDTVDAAWWKHSLNASIHRRRALAASAHTDSYRLVHAEADGLPGLIADRYGDVIVCQFLTAGVEAHRETIVEHLWRQLNPTTVIERSDDEMRKVEGLLPSGGVLRGQSPREHVLMRESGHRFRVNLVEGQKTGFYLDQRDNRQAVAMHARGRRVLDCFSYTGGFAIPVLAAMPASLTCIDSSESALSLLNENVELLHGDLPGVAIITPEVCSANVFELLRVFRDQGRQFDMIILDPPKLAASHAQVARAKRAYKDLNLLAMKLLTTGGVLASFSCSGAITRHDLQSVVGWAATDAQRRVQVVAQLTQADDHPVIVSFPESEYLKGLICIVE